MKSTLDTLFLSTYSFNSLFVLIKCPMPIIFHVMFGMICEVSHMQSIVTTSPVSGLLHHTGHVVTAKNVLIAKQVSIVHVIVITLHYKHSFCS